MNRSPVVTIVRDDGMGEENPRFLVDGHPWHLMAMENYDGIEASVSTADYAQYDGSFLLGERAGETDRTLEIYGKAGVTGTKEDLRAEAEEFFVFGQAYEVHVEYLGRKRFFRARQQRLSISTDPKVPGQPVTWTALALDPYFLDEDERSFNVAEAKKRFGFPFCSFVQRWAPTPEATNEAASEDVYGEGGIAQPAHVRGFVVGVVSRAINVVNSGSSTAYPRFEVTSTGRVVTPRVRVLDASGAEVCSFGVAVALEAGDVLVVDFSARPTAITLNGANVSNKVIPGSTLTAGLAPGRYTVSWSSDSGDASMGLVPSIRERFVTI